MAQGDSWADPIIIGTPTMTAAEIWADFLSKNDNSSYRGKYMRFTDIHLDANNNLDISGTGTRTDPYIVSTYHEMWSVTGATYIYECHLVEEDINDPTADRHYIYNDIRNDRVIYCTFKPIPSLIDFNSIYDSYRSTLYIYVKIDPNGWTWLNLKLTCSDSSGMICTGSSSYGNGVLKHLILLNCIAKIGTARSLCAAKFEDSILQMRCDEAEGSSALGFIYNRDNSTVDYVRCSVSFSIYATGRRLYGGYANSPKFYDSKINLDIEVDDTVNTSAANQLGMYRSVVTGSVRCRNVTSRSSGYPLFNIAYSSIYDVKDEDLGTPSRAYPMISDVQSSVYNKEKNTNWTDKIGFVGVTSEELLSPTTLQSKGLPIGVDT